MDGALAQIRAVRVVPDAKAIDRYNQQMDAAWSLFSSDKARSLPILRQQLQRELRAAQPSPLLLLDVGYFVYLNDSPEGKVVAKDALARIDFRSPVVVANHKELFEFMYAVAKDHDANVLPLIDKAFLASNEAIFVPQHALKLDGTLVCVFLYGAYGPDSESALRARLADKTRARRVLEVLTWIGTPAALPEVTQALADQPNPEVFARVVSYMMQVAGPAGRHFLLTLDADKLDPASRQYLAKVRKAVQDTSFDSIKTSLARIPGDRQLPDDVVLARLDAMIQNFGRDDKTGPMAVLDSGIPAQVLIDKLVSIRSRTLFRLSDEALSDVQVGNALLLALRYRTK